MKKSASVPHVPLSNVNVTKSLGRHRSKSTPSLEIQTDIPPIVFTEEDLTRCQRIKSPLARGIFILVLNSIAVGMPLPILPVLWRKAFPGQAFYASGLSLAVMGLLSFFAAPVAGVISGNSLRLLSMPLFSQFFRQLWSKIFDFNIPCWWANSLMLFGFWRKHVHIWGSVGLKWYFQCDVLPRLGVHG